MFADDAKIFKQIKTPADAVSLQSDLVSMDAWAADAGLLFNQTKCKTQIITRKTKPVTTTYTLKNVALERVETKRDLAT